MNKEELVQELAKRSGLTPKETLDFVDAFTSVISNALTQGDKVNIKDLGVFTLSQRKSYTGFHPQTKEKIEIPAASFARFRPSSKLKAAIK